MSKKEIYSKHLKKGKFYLTYDGSKTGHPGMIYWKNDKKNLYLALTTDTSEGNHRIRLSTPTDNRVKKSYIKTRPFLGKRKDFGSKELIGMRFSKYDKKKTIRHISVQEPRYSVNISRNDKRYFKRLRKKPKY